MRIVLRVILLPTLALAAMLSFAVRDTAFAHAALVSATPAEGGVLPNAPGEIRLRFNEPVAPLAMRLTSVDRAVTVALPASSINNDVLIKASDDIGAGTHVLSWRVVSSDGHPIGGTVSFSVAAPSVAVARIVATSTKDALRSTLIWLARVGVSIGLFIGVGGAFFQAWISRRNARPVIGANRIVRYALALGLISAVSGVGLQGLDALDVSFSSLRAYEAWRASFSTAYGPTLLTAIVAFAAATCSQFASSSIINQRTLSAAGIILVGAALALSGHASSAEPQWLTRPAVFIHGVGIAYWLGALAPLAFMLAAKPVCDNIDLHAALQRFSNIALPVVAAMVAAGTTLAVIQLQSVSALIETAYGRLLLIKLALVASLLCLAVLNRFRLTPAIDSPDPHYACAAQRQFLKSISAELALALLIILVAALWRFTPPPRALALIAAAPATIHIHAADAMADIAVTPGRAGPVRITIDVLNGEFGPLTPKEVTVFLSNPAAGVEEIERAAGKALDQEGRWEVERVIVPLPGKWKIRVDLLITDFRKVTLDDAIDIRP